MNELNCIHISSLHHAGPQPPLQMSEYFLPEAVFMAESIEIEGIAFVKV